MSSSESRIFTLFLIDPKAFGAFIEYTLKPILEEVREILELSGRDFRSLKSAFRLSVCMFIFDRILYSGTVIVTTWLICSTILLILSNSSLITR